MSAKLLDHIHQLKEQLDYEITRHRSQITNIFGDFFSELTCADNADHQPPIESQQSNTTEDGVTDVALNLVIRSPSCESSRNAQLNDQGNLSTSTPISVIPITSTLSANSQQQKQTNLALNCNVKQEIVNDYNEVPINNSNSNQITSEHVCSIDSSEWCNECILLQVKQEIIEEENERSALLANLNEQTHNQLSFSDETSQNTQKTINQTKICKKLKQANLINSTQTTQSNSVHPGQLTDSGQSEQLVQTISDVLDTNHPVITNKPAILELHPNPSDVNENNDQELKISTKRQKTDSRLLVGDINISNSETSSNAQYSPDNSNPVDENSDKPKNATKTTDQSHATNPSSTPSSNLIATVADKSKYTNGKSQNNNQTELQTKNVIKEQASGSQDKNKPNKEKKFYPDKYQFRFNTIGIKCPVNGCNLEFNKTQYFFHLRNDHQILYYQCLHNHCNKSFNKGKQLDDHLQSAHSNVRLWRCFQCQEKFPDHYNLFRHNTDYHCEGTFVCGFHPCDFESKYRIDVIHHFDHFHSNQGHYQAPFIPEPAYRNMEYLPYELPYAARPYVSWEQPPNELQFQQFGARPNNW